MHGMSVLQRARNTTSIDRELWVAALLLTVALATSLGLWLSDQANQDNGVATYVSNTSEVGALDGSTDAGASLEWAVQYGTNAGQLGALEGSTDCGASLQRAVKYGTFKQ